MKKRSFKTTFRTTALAVAAAGTMGIGLFASTSAEAIDLRYNSVIEGSSITLGDVFSGLNGPEYEHKASRILGAAPRPGTDMVLNARTLMRIAIALDLPWRPGSSADQVVLRRAATVIDEDMIEGSIKQALANEGLDAKFNLIIPTSSNQMILPHDMAQSVEITKIEFNPAHDSFTADLAAPSADNPVQTLRIDGKIERLRDVPVLRQTLRNGDIIGVRDIDYIALPVNRLKHNIVLKESELIGMTPRRILTPDEPVLVSEIEAPLAVNRGESVTMTFQHGNLLLTAQGKALENGAKGDLIRVTNLNSSKTVQAVVSGNKEVNVAGY